MDKTLQRRRLRAGIVLMLLITAIMAGSAESTTSQAEDRTIIPGLRVGAIKFDTDEATLVACYGRENVVDEMLDAGEGDTEPGTVLFPNDPSQRLYIFWHDKKHKKLPRSIELRGDHSTWKTDEGITLGTTLKELETLNAGPFRLLGFGHDGSGRVVQYGQGRLQAFDRPLEASGTGRLALALSPYGKDLDQSSETYRGVLGDHEFSSGHPFMQALNPRVDHIQIRLETPADPEKGKQDTVTIVAFGDSTTAPRQVEGKALRIYADILRDELTAKSLSATVLNAGVGGNDTGQARARFEKDVLAHKPEIAVIQFGLNDSCIDLWDGKDQPRVTKEAYGANLQYFVETLRARDCAVILMTANPMRWTPQLLELYGKAPFDVKDPWGFNLLNREYAQTVRDLAKSLDVPLVDVYQGFLDYSATPGHAAEDLLLDGMHPNDRGHALIARWLLEVLDPLLRAR